MKPANWMAGLVVGGVLAGSAITPVFALSADAQLIVAGVQATGGAGKPTCQDVGQLTDVVTGVTRKLALQGKLSGDPHAAGKEAGTYLYENCK